MSQNTPKRLSFCSRVVRSLPMPTDSDSSEEEVSSRGRRRQKLTKPKNVPQKKAKETPLTDKKENGRKRPKNKANSDEDSESSNFSVSSSDSIENHPPNKNPGRRKNDVERAGEVEQELENGNVNSEGNNVDAFEIEENDDEAEKRMRQRRRLSRSFHGAESGLNKSLNASTSENGVPTPDRAGLRSIYSNCIELFQAKKITKENAFNLKLLECLDAIINGPDFDKNDMHMVGRTLEVGTRIYVCRVEHTHSEVMHLASDIAVHNNKLKEKNRNNATQNDEDGEAADNEEMNQDEIRRKAGKKKKRSRFIEEDDEKLCTDFEGQSTKYVTRRLTLKKKFTRMINEELDFDYISYFISPDAPHPLTIENENGECDSVAQLPKAAFDPAEIKKMGFLEFNLMSKFDPNSFDVWGMPLREGDANVSDCQEADVIPVDDNFAYNPDNRPQDYMDDAEGADDDLHDMSQQFANHEKDFEAQFDIENPIAVNKIESLDQLSTYFSAIKNIHQMTKARYGWAGPQFFQPRRNWVRPTTGVDKSKKTRRKKEPIEISFDNIDWKDSTYKYVSCSKERTVLDERTIEKWSFTKTSVPYAGIELNEDDDFTDAFSNVCLESEDSPDFVHSLLRFFIDPNRNIESLLKKEIEKYGGVRDAGEFVDDKGEFPDDSYVHFDDAELSARDNEASFCASNGLLNGEPMENPMELGGENFDLVATLAGVVPPSMGLNFEDDFMTKATDATDSIKYTKKPKPINMHALKSQVLGILKTRLKLDNENGGPTQDDDTSTTLFDLLQQVYRNASKKTVEYLTIPIIVVALMHVVADKKLFMLPGKTDNLDNPLIVCRGKSWSHKDNIPKRQGDVFWEDDKDVNHV